MTRSIPTPCHGRLIALAAVLMLATSVVGSAHGAEEKAAPPTKAKPSRKGPAPQPEFDRVAAKQAYEEALRAFNLGHWQDAIAGFERSYKLSGDAALLFNVAQAQRQAGNSKEAAIAYKAFLRERPDTPHREMIETKLKELEAGAGPKPTSSSASNTKVEPDRLTGIWVDPFVSEEDATPALPLPVPASSPTAAAKPAATVAPPAPATPAPTEPAAAQERQTGQESTATGKKDLLHVSEQPSEGEPGTTPGSRWWLWTGIGAVVTAAVVTAVVLSTRGSERDPSCPSGVNGCLPVGK